MGMLENIIGLATDSSLSIVDCMSFSIGNVLPYITISLNSSDVGTISIEKVFNYIKNFI